MRNFKEEMLTLSEIKNGVVNLTESNLTKNLILSDFKVLEQKIIEKNNLIRFDIFLHLVFICTVFISFFIIFKKNFFLKLRYLHESKCMV